MFGRRPEGKRVKHLDPIVQITPYLMPWRCDAQVFLAYDAEYEPLLPVGADAELCLRLARRGLGAIYAPDARVVLHRPLAAISSAPENVRLRCRDALRHLSINGDPYTPNA